MSKDRTLCEYNEKNPDIIEHLENWVKGRYRKEYRVGLWPWCCWSSST